MPRLASRHPTTYANIRLPVGLMQRVDRQLALDDTYPNRTAWVKAAVIRRLEAAEAE